MTSVKVAVRIRPLSQRERDGNAEIVISLKEKKLLLTNKKIPEYGTEGDMARESTRSKEFSFNYIFWSVDASSSRYCSQEKVFDQFGLDIVSSAYEGYNACAFAYGQPGSGKTYTMIGTKENRGLIPRICEDIFLKMDDSATTYRTELSFMEIYNERVRDLLEASVDRSREGLRVREHPKYGPYVEDLSRHAAENISDVQDLIARGDINRSTAPTNINDTSSRSHAIFTLTFTQARILNGMPYETQSKIHLVDLAGSEGADASGAKGVRLKEGGNINKSLVTLGTVITLLAKSSDVGVDKKVYIPYRDSKLTWLLKDSLGGNARTFMIATVSPADVNYNETLRTLRYAVGAKNIVNRPTKNEDPSVRLIRELKEEITRLKAMLGGDLDKAAEPRVKEMLQESEVRVKVLTDEWTEKWHETDIADHEMAVRKDGLGIIMDSAHPHLVGFDDDIFSTGVTLYNLKVGITTIGRTDALVEQDIRIAGLEVEREHCSIMYDKDNVQIIPKEGALCTVNGSVVTEPTNLTQGAVILLGKTNMFRFNNPAEAIKMKEELKDSGLSLLRSSAVGYGRSISDMYRSTDSLESATWETTNDYGEEIDKLNDQRKQIDLFEQRFDQAQQEREMEISALEQDVQDILVSLEELKEQLQKSTKQNTLYTKSVQKLTDEHNKAREAILEELDHLKTKLETTTKSSENDMLILDEKENDLVISQITLQTNVHSKIDNILENKLQTERAIAESKKQLQTLQELYEIETRKIKAVSKVHEDILNNVLSEQVKAQSELELKYKCFEDKRLKTDSTMTLEIKRIDEAWQDINEHETELRSVDIGRLEPTEKAKLRQKEVHLNEAKELLQQEQASVAENHKQIVQGLEKEQRMLEEETWKGKEELQSKKQSILSTLSATLCQIDKDIYETQKCIIEKEKDLLNEVHELDNLEEMLSISTSSCTKQQKEISEQKEKKKELCSQFEETTKNEIAELHNRLLLLDNELKESTFKLRHDILNSLSDETDAASAELLLKNENEIRRLQELYDQKHPKLLRLKQQAEEQQDKEFEILEMEIIKLEEMQHQARIEQEVKRRLKNVRQNKTNKRRLYESFASIETDTSGSETNTLQRVELYYTIQCYVQEEQFTALIKDIEDALVKILLNDGNSSSSANLTSVSGIGVNVTSYCLKNCGSDSFYEFEVQMLIGKDNWTVYRRYSKFREMHKELRRRIPEMRRIQFPPKKIFTKSEKVLEQRRKQLEIYLQDVLEIFIKTPWCPLHPLQNKNLNMKLLCDFEPFFRRGLFERSSSAVEKK